MRLQVASIAKRFMQQMQADKAKEGADAEKTQAQAESSVQVGINMENPMMERMKKQAMENMQIFGTAQPNVFVGMCTDEGDILVMRAHQAAKTAMKAVKPDLKIGLTLSLHDIQAVEGGEENAAEEAAEAQAAGNTFEADGQTYTFDESGNVMDASGATVAMVSPFVISASDGNTVIPDDLREALLTAIDADASEVVYTDEAGAEHSYSIEYDAYSKVYNVTETTENMVYDRYASPSLEHWLGTDGNGMDMLTRLMYGGRVSLIIGFIVVFIAAGLGVIMGGISGYFGGWVDNLIMRIVDIFYCLPSMPIIIILGSAMDAMRLDPWIRMIYLMLILGFLSWPGIARLVRGQILSLREQEFMLATEATGITVPHRIIRHLIPNVMPQLIVSCTMSLGSTIITEATLSFLGLGVKFPFASWGNIISDVNNAFVMTNYWFIWIPAGICLLLAVLGFNFVGDGLRDAFDPKMNR